jgi:RimJ/RimL family protein N-acetyltransferase
MDYKYKKILLNNLIKKINSNKIYKDFTQKYIDNYLKKIKINTIDEFIQYNLRHLEKYKLYDSNTKIYFHYMVDKKENRIVSMEKSIIMNKHFFDIKYFKNIINDINSVKEVSYNINLYVDEHYRGKSICKNLLQRIIKNCKKNNINYIISEINDDNIPSIKCHLANNFVKTNIISYPNTYFYIMDNN